MDMKCQAIPLQIKRFAVSRIHSKVESPGGRIPLIVTDFSHLVPREGEVKPASHAIDFLLEIRSRSLL
ncbi:hypothetical protein D5086_004354 [Populus alba]|uniref:Uncharacterized protein n=1 Tax=Populus alba TaxID=43335 RepID=A0ACC4CQ99_POPAL